MNKPYRTLIAGPILTRSGYAVHTRNIFRALRSRPDLFDIYVIPLGWGQCGWDTDLDTQDERQFIDDCVRKTLEAKASGQTEFDIWIQVSIPQEFERKAKINIGATAAAETTKVTPLWVQKCGEMEKILVVSEHAAQVLQNSTFVQTNQQTGQSGEFRLTDKPIVIGYPVKSYPVIDLGLKLDYDFNYLMVAQWGPRKNIENTLKWFLEENKDKEVGLVAKLNIAANNKVDQEYTLKRLKNIKDSFKDAKCKLYLLHGEMTDAEVHSLYVDPRIKGLISLAHGESFGLPIFEAAYSGLPVITPAWGGPCDFMYAPTKKDNGKAKMRPHFLRVDYTMSVVQKEAVWKGVIEEDAMWCFPEEKSFKEQMRELEKNYGLHKSRAETLKKYLRETYTEEVIYKKYVDAIMSAVEPQGQPAAAAPSIITI